EVLGVVPLTYGHAVCFHRHKSLAGVEQDERSLSLGRGHVERGAEDVVGNSGTRESGSLDNADTIQHGDTSLAEVVEAVTTLELDVHELLVVKQHVEDFGLHQRNEFTQGATEVTVDELSKC